MKIETLVRILEIEFETGSTQMTLSIDILKLYFRITFCNFKEISKLCISLWDNRFR